MEKVDLDWLDCFGLSFGGSFGGIEHGWVGIWPKDFFVLSDDGSSDDFILQVDFVLVVFVDHELEEFADVVGVKSGALSGHSGGKIEVADDFDTIVGNDLTFFGEFAVSTIFGSQIDDDAAWLHEFNHVFGDEFWSWFSWNEGSCNDDVDLLALLSEQLHFGLNEFLTHFLCIPSHTSATFTESLHFQKLCPQ